MFDYFTMKTHVKADETHPVELSYLELYYLITILDNIDPKYDPNSQNILKKITEKFNEAQETIR